VSLVSIELTRIWILIRVHGLRILLLLRTLPESLSPQFQSSQAFSLMIPTELNGTHP